MNETARDASSGTSSDGQDILLTGATGYLGAFLLDELLAQTSRKINCLVRAADDELARRRVQESLMHYDRWNEGLADRIIVTRGDLSLPLLGLGSDEFNVLAETTGTIFHNGALVNYLFPLSRMRAVNVEGTLSLIRLATAAWSPAYFHYISLSGQDPISAYGKSKLEAEEKVREAASHGMPASVYKISRLAPDSRTGLPNKSDILIRLLEIILQVGIAPGIEFSENWVSVDIAARAIVETALKSCEGQAFSLNPQGDTSFRDLIEVGRENGFRIKIESLTDWLRLVREINSQEYELTIRALRLDDVTDGLYVEPGTETPTDQEDNRDGFPINTLEVPGVDRAALDRYFARRSSSGRR